MKLFYLTQKTKSHPLTEGQTQQLGQLYAAYHIQMNTFIYTRELQFHFHYLCESNHLTPTFTLKKPLYLENYFQIYRAHLTSQLEQQLIRDTFYGVKNIVSFSLDNLLRRQKDKKDFTISQDIRIPGEECQLQRICYYILQHSVLSPIPSLKALLTNLDFALSSNPAKSQTKSQTKQIP